MPTLGVTGILFFYFSYTSQVFSLLWGDKCQRSSQSHKKTVKKTMSHRKQILVFTSVASKPDEDEIVL